MSVTLEQLEVSYATIQQQQSTISQHTQTISGLQAQLAQHQQTLSQVSEKWNALEAALRSAVVPPPTRDIPAQPVK
jgi:uncharacterized coiled-coil protein SlyX